MSLATTGGGGLGGAGGAGGLAMGHDAAGGQAMANIPNAPPIDAAGAGATGTASSAPSGVAIEVFDKTQKTTLSQVKQTAHLPLTAVDLYANNPTVALFPPKSAQGNNKPVFLGKMKHTIGFQASDTAHKTLRKYLTQTKPYSALKQDALVTKIDNNNDSIVLVDRPHLLLGQRRTSLLSQPLQSQFTIDTEGSHSAISQEGTDSNKPCCWWTDSTLDGSTPNAKTIDHDMDRVVCKLRLSNSKKALTLLPEEACSLLLHQARTHVASKYPKLLKEDLTHFPVALAVPSWALNDATMEALYEAAQFSDASDASEPSPAVLFPRSLCSLMGSFVKPEGGPERNPFLNRIAKVQQALLQRHKRLAASPKERFVASTLIITIGSTPEQGVECTAIQLSYPQNSVPLVFYEECNLVANVSRLVQEAAQAPATLLAECLAQLEQVLEQVAPDLDGPAAVLTYGTTAEQEALTAALAAYTKDVKDNWLERVPVIAASVEAVPTGAALLGGLALGRLTAPDDPKTLPVKLQSTAAVATGLCHYYSQAQARQFNQTPPTDQDVKVIFDFDRRLPAGPYAMEFKASECVVHGQRNSHTKDYVYDEDDEAFVKAVKEAESSKQIPQRETAALDFTVQVFQKWTRTGPWCAVGNPMAPLVKLDTQLDPDTDEDQDETKIACEQVTMELSASVTGTLSTAWAGERESVVQAVKSARGRLLEWWGWTLFAVALFGGFFCKSWWEDHVWKRDTQRLLDYYKNVIPGSMQDGDYDTAAWLAYKYRHKKDVLWKNLEDKYGVPIPENFVWPERNETDDEDDEEVEDLDDEKDEEDAKTEGGDDEASASAKETEDAETENSEPESSREQGASETAEEGDDDGDAEEGEEQEDAGLEGEEDGASEKGTEGEDPELSEKTNAAEEEGNDEEAEDKQKSDAAEETLGADDGSDAEAEENTESEAPDL